MSVQHNNQPLVSVLVPSYNHSKYIEECLASIYNAQYENLQVIVIDDNSSDGSQDILKELEKEYGFELVLKDKNKGLVDSLNTGLKEFVKGDIIKLVASDDILVKGVIQKAVEYFSSHPDIEVLFGKAYKINEDSSVLGNIIPRVCDKLTYENFQKGKISYNITTLFYRRSVWDKIGYFKEGIISEDIHLNHKIWKNCNVGFLDEFVTYYRSHGENTTKNTWLMYQESLKFFESIKGEEYYIYQNRLSNLYHFVALSSSYKNEALKYFLPSLRFWNRRLFWIGLIKLILK